jgi:hypothetical protein
MSTILYFILCCNIKECMLSFTYSKDKQLTQKGFLELKLQSFPYIK